MCRKAFLFLIAMSGIAGFSAPAEACEKAPEVIALEQLSSQAGQEIEIRWKDPCGGASHYLLSINGQEGLRTVLFPGKASAKVNVTQIEGTRRFQVSLCYPSQACSPKSVSEEIYVFKARKPLVRNFDIAWKVPVAGVDFPNIHRFKVPQDPAWCKNQAALAVRSPDYDAYCSRGGFVSNRCQDLSSTDCWAAANDGSHRIIRVPSAGQVSDPRYRLRPFYILYTQQKNYLKDLINAYFHGIQLQNKIYLDPRLSDPKWFGYALEGFIRSAEVRARPNGSLFMTEPLFPGFYTSSIDEIMWTRDFTRILRSSFMAAPGSSLYHLRKYRWTLYSVLKNVVAAFEVPYQEGGLLVKDPGRNDYFISFPGNPYTVSGGNYAKGDALISLGKFMATLEDMDAVQGFLRDLSKAKLGMVAINDSLAQRIDGMIQRGVTRLGGRPIAYSVTIRDFYNSATGYGDYSWNLVTNRRQGVSQKTNFTKACGGYGGDWLGNPANKVSSTDIGQVRNMHFLLFGYVGTNSPDYVSDSARFEELYRKGTGFAKRFFPDPSNQHIQEIAANYFDWIEGCCWRYATDVAGETVPPYCKIATEP